MKTKTNLIIVLFALMLSTANFAQKGKGAKSTATKSSVSVGIGLSKASGYTSIVKAIQTANFDDMLKGTEEFTVLAPTDAAFNSKPGLLNSFMEPGNYHPLRDVVAYHMIYGVWNVQDFARLVANGKGKGQIKTTNGEVLTVTRENKSIYLEDKNGNKAKITAPDNVQSNGVWHGIDAVFSPTKKL